MVWTATHATLNYNKFKGIKGGNTKIEVINATSPGVRGWAEAVLRGDDFINYSDAEN